MIASIHQAINIFLWYCKLKGRLQSD